MKTLTELVLELEASYSRGEITKEELITKSMQLTELARKQNPDKEIKDLAHAEIDLRGN